jgi:flavonol synthase
MTLGATLLWKKNHAIRDALASCRLFLSDFLPVLSRCWAPCIYCCDSMGVGVRAKTQLSAMGEEVVQSVQALAPSLAALPPEFMRPNQEQPGATTFGGPAAPGAPVIDMSEPGYGARIAEAAREWGLFQVVNHGVPASAVAELQRVGRGFFALPQEEKERHVMDPASGKIEGYGTKLQRDLYGKKTWNDSFFHVVAPPAMVNHGVWPERPAGYREANEEYCRHLQRLTRDLFEHHSVGLGLEKGALIGGGVRRQ